MSRIELSEVLGALSVVADLGVGAPAETGIGAALLAGRLGRRLGLPEADCATLFYASLLRFIGCSVAVPETIELSLGDVHGYQRALALADLGNRDDIMARLDAEMATDEPAAARRASLKTIGGVLGDAEVMGSVSRSHCDLAAQLARDVGLPPAVVEALGQVYERWDGRGLPAGTERDGLSLAARVLHVTTAFELHRRTLGLDSALQQVRARSGGQFDPVLCDVVTAAPAELVGGLEAGTLLNLFLDEAPGSLCMDSDRIIDVARACGHNVDHRSVYTLGHSEGVADVVARAGAAADLPEDVCERLRIAGYFHDIGRVGISSRIWDKPGPLTRVERARVEQHTFLTDDILRASPALEAFATLASSAHERPKGAGYHRRLETPDQLGQLLAAADTYHAMREQRPWRAGKCAETAANELLAEANEERVDRRAVHAVLDAVGGRRPSRSALPGNLSKREAEVLSLLAQGMTNRQIGGELFISEKTVEHHVGHVYDKIGSRGRAAAAMFAVKHGLCAK